MRIMSTTTIMSMSNEINFIWLASHCLWHGRIKENVKDNDLQVKWNFGIFWKETWISHLHLKCIKIIPFLLAFQNEGRNAWSIKVEEVKVTWYKQSIQIVIALALGIDRHSLS